MFTHSETAYAMFYTEFYGMILSLSEINSLSLSFTLPHCFGRLLSAHNRRSSPSWTPSRIPRFVRSSFLTGCGATTQHRLVYGTYGGRYVLWLIVLLSLTYFQFTAAARRFASWLSIVRDERRFMCHPGYSAYVRLAFYPSDTLTVSNIR